MAIVVGAGNLFRARYLQDTKVDRVTADYIGMLGTMMNSLALQEAIERLGGEETRLMSGFQLSSVAELFIRRKAIHHLKKGRIVIFGGGTGSPFFTTDSAAALRACEIGCDVILKGSNVDGVYTKDPKKYKNVKMYKNISYKEALKKRLAVIDSTAIALCQEEKMPIIVFNIKKFSVVKEILEGKKIGTLIG